MLWLHVVHGRACLQAEDDLGNRRINTKLVDASLQPPILNRLSKVMVRRQRGGRRSHPRSTAT